MAAVIGVLILALATAIFLPKILKRGDEPDYYTLKCESFAVQNSNLAKGQIVFIGDSITDLCPLDSYYAELPLASYNRGIAGDTTSGVLDRLDVSAFDLEPSKIVLMIGTNDVNGSDSVAEIAKRYDEIIKKLTATLPNTEIFCMSVIPENEDLESYTEIIVANTSRRILELNVQIEEIANRYGATYVNIYPLLADENDRMIRAYSDDGIHLNSAGFAVWAELITPYLA